MTIYTMVGLPGAGKSTFASNYPDFIIVSTDAIRSELFGDESDQQNGKLVFDTAYHRLAQAVAMNRNVIFDATNLRKRDRKKLFQKFPNANHIAVFMDTPINICKERNAKRERQAPESVIDRMAANLEVPSTEEGFEKVIIRKV